jgi:hypothetical protein
MIAAALTAYANATARAFEGRENSVGASEVGQCSRKVFFAKNESDPIYGASSDTDYANPWGAALRGRLLEDHFWVPALQARYGNKLRYAGGEQQTLTSGFLSATPDGLLIKQPVDALAALGVADIGGDHSIVVECKSVDPRTKLDAPRPEHAFQAVVQLGLFCELTPHRPQWAAIAYINASFPDDVVEFPVQFDAAVFANAKRRAAQIITAQSPAELKPEGWIAGGRECEFCSFTKACGVIRHAVPTQPVAEPPDRQFVAEIADLARDAKHERLEAETATTALREIEHEIKERLQSKGLRRIEGDGVSVIWAPVKGRPAYNMKAIREAAAKAGIDLAEYQTVGEPSDRLTIRVAGQSAAAPDHQQEKTK